MIKQPKTQQPIPPESTPMVSNKPAPCAQAPMVWLQNQLSAPHPRVHPKETSPEVDPIAHHTRSHMRTVEPLFAQNTRDQLQQALTVTPSQASQWYFPKDILALCTTPITALAMLVLDAETGE